MSKRPWRVFLGFDPREAAAFSVARESLCRYHRNTPAQGIVLSDLQARGLYTRPTERRLGKLWDEISQAWMSTEFSISRFLVPEIVKRQAKRQPYGWAIFMDCDVLVRGSLSPLIEQLDDDKALYCVHHVYEPSQDIKMDGQVQYSYPRKNWSSVMAINCDHEANDALTVELVNTARGLDLHTFSWLDGEGIGELGPEWNYLVNHTTNVENPTIVHFTDGIPTMPGYADCEYSKEWFEELERWAA